MSHAAISEAPIAASEKQDAATGNVGLGFTVGTAPTCCPCMEFYDSFDRPTLGPDWNVEGTTFAIDGGELMGTDVEAYPFLARFTPNTELAHGISIEATVMVMPEHASDPPTGAPELGVYIGDPTTPVFYYLGLNYTGIAGNQGLNSIYPLTPLTRHKVKLCYHQLPGDCLDIGHAGGRLTAYVDDREAATALVNLLATDRCGVYVKNNAGHDQARFDYFRVLTGPCQSDCPRCTADYAWPRIHPAGLPAQLKVTIDATNSPWDACPDCEAMNGDFWLTAMDMCPTLNNDPDGESWRLHCRCYQWTGNSGCGLQRLVLGIGDDGPQIALFLTDSPVTPSKIFRLYIAGPFNAPLQGGTGGFTFWSTCRTITITVAHP